MKEMRSDGRSVLMTKEVAPINLRAYFYFDVLESFKFTRLSS
jgi:hypothetical protein